MRPPQASAPARAWAWLCDWLTSTAFRSGLQLACGAFVAALFTFVVPMRFVNACLAMTLYIVQSILVAQDTHVGSKVLASCMVMGAALVGAIAGGIVMTIAKAASFSPYQNYDDPSYEGYNALYCCLATVGLAILCINRVGANPPFLWAVGMISCVLYGIVLISAQLAPAPSAYVAQSHGAPLGLIDPIPWAWKNVVGFFLLCVVVGAGCNVLATLLVLPSLATDELRDKVAEALLGIGAGVSQYSSKIFEPEARDKALGVAPASVSITMTEGRAPGAGPEGGQEGEGQGAEAGSRESRGAGDQGPLASTPTPSGTDDAEVVDYEPDEDVYMAMLREATMGPPKPPALRHSASSSVLKAGSALLKTLHVTSTPHATAITIPPNSPAGDDDRAEGVAGAGGPPPLPPTPGPGGPPMPGGKPRPASMIHALLGRARGLTPFAIMEPAFVSGYTFNPAAWGAVIGATEILLRRVAALEMILEEKTQVMGDATMENMMELNFIPEFRLAFAQIAATCAAMAATVRASMKAGQKGDSETAPMCGCLPAYASVLCSKGRWQSTKAELSAKLHEALRGYWRRVRTTREDKKVHIMDGGRMRALMFMVTLTHGICDAMEDVEEALLKAVSPKAAEARAAKKAAEAAAAAAKEAALNPQPALDGEDAPAAPAPAAPASPPKPPLLPAWLSACLMLCSGLPALGGLMHALLSDLPAVFQPGGASAMLRSRVFQAGVKYFIALAIILLMMLGLGGRQDTVGAAVQQYKPIFGYIAVCISMTERVEAAVSNLVLWIVGTVLGGTVGLFAMWDPHSADNPYALMALVCGVTFISGLLISHQHKRLVVLSLMCMDSVILCQYQAYCSSKDCHGASSYFAARMLSVVFGTLVTGLVNNLLFPWFTSTWALQVLGKSLKSAMGVTRTAYQAYYSEGQAALAAASSKGGVVAEAIQSVHVPSFNDGQSEASGPMSRTGSAAVPGQMSRAGSATLARISENLRTRGMGMLDEAAAAPPPGSSLGKTMQLASAVAGPLQAVQVSLIKDTTFWHVGLLATPPVIPRLLQQEFMLLDRLAGLVLTLRGPEITGSFTGWSFKSVVLPMHDDLMEVCGCADKMADAAVRILEGDHSDEARANLKGVIAELMASRLKVRNHVVQGRREVHLKMRSMSLEQLPYVTNPDDSVRTFSFIFALIKFLNKATQIAHIVLELDVKQLDSVLSYFKS